MQIAWLANVQEQSERRETVLPDHFPPVTALVSGLIREVEVEYAGGESADY